VNWSDGKPGVEDVLFAEEASRFAYYGQLAKARKLADRAVASAQRQKEVEVAASYEANFAEIEAIFGNVAQARKKSQAALTLSHGPEVRFSAAVALAIAGERTSAEAIAEDLNQLYPQSTAVQYIYLPVIRAQSALSNNDASKTVDALRASEAYELGTRATLYPAYVRGQAYLFAHEGSKAAAEFQKILDHRGVVVNDSIGSLAHLQLARAYAVQGDKVKARTAYSDFLTLWKDADPDVPIYTAAKAEFAKLH
jgi:tetratricopeptide (TPR) repeat protein